MTVVEKTRSTAPRSALRYRPITTGLGPVSQTVPQARKSRGNTRVATAPAVPDDLDQERHPVSRPRRTGTIQRIRLRRSIHPLFFIGLGTLITLILWVGVAQLLAWGTDEYNAIVYGSPRTFQLDAVVGQGDSRQHPSHFESINLHGVVTILEFPAGDAHSAHVLATYTVPEPQADRAVALLRFLDVSQNGRPDMVIDIDGIQSVLVNDGTTFRPPTPGEQQEILQALQHSQN